MKYNVHWSDDAGVVRIARVDVTVKRDGSAAIINIVKPDWLLGRRDYAFRLVVNTLIQARLASRVRLDASLANTSLAIYPGSDIMGYMMPKRGVSNPGWKVIVNLRKQESK